MAARPTQAGERGAELGLLRRGGLQLRGHKHTMGGNRPRASHATEEKNGGELRRRGGWGSWLALLPFASTPLPSSSTWKRRFSSRMTVPAHGRKEWAPLPPCLKDALRPIAARTHPGPGRRIRLRWWGPRSPPKTPRVWSRRQGWKRGNISHQWVCEARGGKAGHVPAQQLLQLHADWAQRVLWHGHPVGASQVAHQHHGLGAFLKRVLDGGQRPSNAAGRPPNQTIPTRAQRGGAAVPATAGCW
jgi:hypothetical protein